MTFGTIIEHLKSGGYATRTGWNGRGMHIALQNPDEHSANTLPYIWMKTAQGDRVPWVASHTDILADDWKPLFHDEA
jgi:hypothetical protein